MPTYLVSGGAGFIGANLCNLLIEQGNKVINIDNFNSFYDPGVKRNNVKPLACHPDYELHVADIRDKTAVKKIFSNNKIDALIHLAGMAGVRPSIDDPLLYEDVNVKGTLNLLECMKEYGVRKLIFGSSSSVYGNMDYHTGFREDQPAGHMISPYAITKKAGEDLCFLYHHLYNINTIALRFFTVYGPGQRPDLAIHKFTKLIIAGRPVPFYGDGTSMRDYSYISDIVAGIHQALNYLDRNDDVFEIINLSGNRPISLKELLHAIETATGKKAIIDRLPFQPGDVAGTNAAIGKARELLNYDPKTTMEEGLKKFVEWYKASFNL